MKGDACNRDNLRTRARALSISAGNSEGTESLTREMNWKNVFGRLNGVYPKAPFHKTVNATY